MCVVCCSRATSFADFPGLKSDFKEKVAAEIVSVASSAGECKQSTGVKLTGGRRTFDEETPHNVCMLTCYVLPDDD